jgi:Arabinose efflux permease
MCLALNKGVIVSDDPRALIADAPMHYRQIAAIAVLTACTAAEGFDVYAIAFASPEIAKAWGIDRAILGITLSMDLVGMGIGALLLGWIADRIGRRPVILACLCLMASGMWLASIANDVTTLSAIRLFTGLGVGGLLATGSALAAEFANIRSRSLAITLMIGGYSVGAIAGGTLASTLLARTDRWQAVFEAGALATGALIVPALLFVPESIDFLCQRQPRGALFRINRILKRLALPPIDRLPDKREGRSGVAPLFERRMIGTTFALTLSFFMYMVTLYFLTKWIPKLVADMGHPVSSAGNILVWTNVGGLTGTIAISLLTRVCNVRYLVVGALVCGAAAVVIFGRISAELLGLGIVATTAGFCIIGANSGFYSIVAQSFPSQLRAGGTGFVIGVGRAGSAVGPIAAGLLFEAGWSLGAVSALMACGCVVAALSVSRVRTLAAAPTASRIETTAPSLN